VDVLLERLKQAQVVGSLGYADDVCLLAPSCNAVNSMLMICETYGAEFQVKFNSTKSRVTVCCNNITCAPNVAFTLNGQTIGFQTSVTHLGYPVGNPECKRSVIDKGISDMYARTNFVLTKFGSCNSDVRNFLFRTYCTSFYGSPLWS